MLLDKVVRPNKRFQFDNFCSSLIDYLSQCLPEYRSVDHLWSIDIFWFKNLNIGLNLSIFN